jgi:ketosteroid isomerase-like protein
MTTTESAHARDEAQLRQLIADQMRAICANDLDRLMHPYAAEVVVFDAQPPFQTTGADAWRRTWEACLPYFPDSLQTEMRDLSLTVSGDVALAHWLWRLTGKDKDHIQPCRPGCEALLAAEGFGADGRSFTSMPPSHSIRRRLKRHSR